MKQSECPVCRRDVLADSPGLQAVCPQCKKDLADKKKGDMMNKQTLKEELVDLRMYLAEAENQALKIISRPWFTSYKGKLINEAHKDIQSADDKLCELAELLGLDKLDVVEPERVN